MGRLTEMIAYLNSSKEDWQKTNGIKLSQFSSYTIDIEGKRLRKWYRYSEESCYADFLKNTSYK